MATFVGLFILIFRIRYLVYHNHAQCSIVIVNYALLFFVFFFFSEKKLLASSLRVVFS